MVYIQFMTAGLMTIFASIGLSLLEKNEKYNKLSYIQKQIIIGIVFGFVACMATQFGIKSDGYIMNVRQAAPLTAALLFGAPSGLIAGVIGAVYRWVSIYWGIGTYTRIACTLGTLFAGILGAILRKLMFNDRKVSSIYGFIIGMTVEVIHMLLVFLTHLSDIDVAFGVVKECAAPMILVNSLTVMISIFAVNLFSNKKIRTESAHRPITNTFSISLMICVIIVFCITIGFTFQFQDIVSNSSINRILKLNNADVVSEIKETSDNKVLSLTEGITEDVDTLQIIKNLNSSNREEKRNILKELASQYEVDEINVVNNKGVIVLSTNSKFDNFSMSTDENGQASKFLCLLKDKKEYVAPISSIDYDRTISMKYAGVQSSNGGFVQVGYEKDHYHQLLDEFLEPVASYNHIEKTGFSFIVNATSLDLISEPEDAFSDVSYDNFKNLFSSYKANQVVKIKTDSNQEYYCIYQYVEGYYVCSAITVSEALFSRDMSVYIGIFMLIIVFFVLFVLIYYLIQTLIIKNIHKINDSLDKIAKGDLSEVVDVRSNEEFSSLSDDINVTVDTLKTYISDAEKRIDQELELARVIQSSALPSIFPPYPKRTEFDIYASMNPAKEVGGDFYDFFFVGKKYLFVVIADVSGKGIPAAMFMMTAKVMIKSLAETGLPVNEVLTQANEKLCEMNDAEMFVTVWLGKIDLSTGILTYASAGHNPPLLGKSNGKFDYLKGRKSLVLAGMEGIQYPLNEYQLYPGDSLYLYTDGITEATNKENELYGETRLYQFMNSHDTKDVTTTCKDVLEDVNSFVNEAEQFDDMTMLMFRLKEIRNLNEFTFIPLKENQPILIEFINKWLDRTAVSQNASVMVHNLLTEVYPFIVNESRASYLRIFYQRNPDNLYLMFEDNGISYTSTELDIFRSTINAFVQDFSYTRHDGINVLTFEIKETD